MITISMQLAFSMGKFRNQFLLGDIWSLEPCFPLFEGLDLGLDRAWEAGMLSQVATELLQIPQGLVNAPFWGFVSHHLQLFVGDQSPIVR